MKTKNTNRQKGTFLIEALITIVVVGIVMTTAFPALVDWTDKARNPAVTCPTCGAYAPCYNHSR